MLLFCLTFFLTSCGGSSGGSSSGSPSIENNGDVSKLSYTAPNIIPSLNNANNSGYLIVTNTSTTNITNISYQLSDTVGGGNKIYIDDASKKNCSFISANGKCTMKLIVPAGTNAGSFSIKANNTLSKIAKNSTKAFKDDTPTKISIHIGIEVAKASTATGPDGIQLYYHQDIIAGTPYMIVTGYVSSPNTGNFNNVVLVDENGNPIPNQEVISGNLGSGLTNLTQGSTFEILVPLTQEHDITQIFKVQTSELNADNTTSNIQITNDTYSITTMTNKAIISVLPSNIILNTATPSQTITLFNNGSVPAQIKELTSTNNNIDIQVSPGIVPVGKFVTATISLKNTNLPTENSSLTLKYNNGTNDINYLMEVEQNTTPINQNIPIAGLNINFEPDNNTFNMSTNSKPVSQKIVLANTGNTDETGFSISGLASGFSISNGTSVNPCLVSGSTITNTLTTTGENYSCDITITYSGSKTPTSGTSTLSIAYNYDSATPATPAQLAYKYNVTQAAAIIGFTTDTTLTFAAILNNNFAYSSQIATIINSGDAMATNVTPNISGTNAQLFSISNTVEGITKPCGVTLSAGQSCQIGVKFGPTQATSSNNLSSILKVNYVSEGINTNRSSNTTSLTGSIITAQSANITSSVTAKTGFAGGDGSDKLPLTLETNHSASITYTLVNNSKVDAIKFFIAPINLINDDWSAKNSCGTEASTQTLKANGGTCTITFTFAPKTSGANNLNFNIITANWSDQVSPQGTSKKLSGTLYVSAYSPASITVITSLGNSPPYNIATGLDFTVSATLSGGYNVAPQAVSLGIIPTNSEISFTNNDCKISSLSPSCTVTVNTNGNLNDNPLNKSYTISLAPIPGIHTALPDIAFTMNRLRIFTTNAVYNGNLGGLSGANDKCNNDTNKPTNSGNFKALLYGNNATQKNILYFRLDNSTLIARANSSFFTNIVLDNAIMSIPDFAKVWVGLNILGINPATCNNWTLSDNTGIGAFDLNINNVPNPVFFPTFGSNCDQELHLYCAEQP